MPTRASRSAPGTRRAFYCTRRNIQCNVFSMNQPTSTGGRTIGLRADERDERIIGFLKITTGIRSTSEVIRWCLHEAARSRGWDEAAPATGTEG